MQSNIYAYTETCGSENSHNFTNRHLENLKRLARLIARQTAMDFVQDEGMLTDGDSA